VASVLQLLALIRAAAIGGGRRLVVLGPLWFVALAAGAESPPAPAAGAALPSSDGLHAVLALGPWPPAPRRDPGNRVSGQPLAIELGRQLFRDPRMSPVGYIACVTCHQPDRAFTDIKARAHGLADLPRNTPALANLSLQRWYGWGGASDSLWMASIKPILDAREFDGNAALVTRLFVREPDLAACYRRVFGVSPLHDSQRTVVNVGKALAAFVETLVTARTPFDDFRDALARGDTQRANTYPAAAQRGLMLFVGRGGCASCHSGPNFSDGGFHAGVEPGDDTAAAIAHSLADSGRLADARYLKASAFNLTGATNDDATRRNAAATRKLVVRAGLSGQYRTPSLRNVAVTAPYFHNGQTEQLRDAILHAQPRSATAADPPATTLTIGDVDDLAAFLATLTDAHGARRPWSSSATLRCP
jgi:cytochrome c peroxidase